MGELQICRLLKDRCILNITWLEHVTNFEVRIGVLDNYCYLILCRPDALSCLAMAHGPGGQVTRSLQCSTSLHIAHSKTHFNWLRTVEEDMRQFNLGLMPGLRRAQNRIAWRTLAGTAASRISSLQGWKNHWFFKLEIWFFVFFMVF